MSVKPNPLIISAVSKIKDSDHIHDYLVELRHSGQYEGKPNVFCRVNQRSGDTHWNVFLARTNESSSAVRRAEVIRNNAQAKPWLYKLAAQFKAFCLELGNAVLNESSEIVQKKDARSDALHTWLIQDENNPSNLVTWSREGVGTGGEVIDFHCAEASKTYKR